MKVELLRVGAGESTASATDTNDTSFATQSNHKTELHKTTSGKTPSKLAILSHAKPSDFRFVTWFMSFLKFDLPQL